MRDAISCHPAPATAGERIVAIDAVRGLAVLGILVMNIVEFGLPLRAYDNPAWAGGAAGADRWFWYLQVSLFDGKMRALFSMLFGAGLVLFAQRQEAAGRGAVVADLLLRRCLWLIPFGIAHRFLLQWTGDILYIYGLFGALAVAFRTLRARWLCLVGLLVLAGQLPQGWLRYAEAAQTRADAARAAASAAAGEEVAKDLAAARERWERRVNALPPKPEALQGELDAIRGSWLSVARHRWEHNHSFQSTFVYSYFVFDAFGMILLGMGLLRAGFFHGRWPRWAYAALLAAAAAAAGAGLLWGMAFARAGFSPAAIELRLVRDLGYPFTRLLVALGFAVALILAVRAGALLRVTTALAQVGRLAFSNYVLQTVLCTTLFFGWGLGLYGSLSRAELAGVWVGVTAVQLGWSALWVRCFRYGPFEWLWRSLTLWRWQPWRLPRAA